MAMKRCDSWMARIALAAASLAMPAMAQAAADHLHGHKGHASGGGHASGAPDKLATRSAMAGETPMADGEVRRVAADSGRVTIKHGEIAHLSMPPMTMVFAVRDKTMLEPLKVGDRIRFAVVDEGGGRMVVTAIEIVR
jgi:Cu(I)/Ag(I) efflux system protein CusF